MANYGFPISRKGLYAFIIAESLASAFFRHFVVPDMSAGYHVFMVIATFVDIAIILEIMLYTAMAMENRLPFADHPIKRVVIQTCFIFIVTTIISEFLLGLSEEIFDFVYPPLVKKFSFMLYFLTAVILNMFYWGTIQFFSWKKNLISLANMEREHAIVRYDFLKNQINPHFLFNCLASLNGLIPENSALATDFVQQLSKVYRYVLLHKEKETVTVRTELQFTDNYIYLLKTRFNSAISFNIDLEDAIKDKEIVPVTLQILFENAMKHNVMSTSTPLVITVTAETDYLVVRNSLNLKQHVESSNHIGLENLRNFYRYLTTKEIEVEKSAEFFAVKVPLI